MLIFLQHLNQVLSKCLELL